METPPYYPPAPPPCAAPPRRRRSRWLTVGLPVGAVLGLGAIVAAVVLVTRTVSAGIGSAEQAARDYATALVDQRWQDAHEQLCARDRSAITADQLARHYGQPRVTGYTVLGVAVSNYDGRSSAQTDIEFRTADGLTTRTEIPLAQDGSRWRPCP